jgi:hypothetical protein
MIRPEDCTRLPTWRSGEGKTWVCSLCGLVMIFRADQWSRFTKISLN